MTRPSLPPDYVAGLRVLIESIPPGRVIAYSDAAEAIGYGSGRHSAAALAGGLVPGVPWWRVIRADGSIVERLAPEAWRRWAEEGTPLMPDGKRVRMALARWRADDDVLRAVDAAIEAASAQRVHPSCLTGLHDKSSRT
ncbi:MGMT family protein [Falsarthrobacter nasiphocae]|uniref:Alkylated DNA nucleotide flippase Atl1 n=1 Tax=Falsarthrobacter nasiphocae TaxID=189863 RepID=A0AAE3YEX7_9MICC|nr:MGMT family protein [Falsarthrobacter nasiphocae]MDR6891452.1 alkylated DNA nucleotide flippase Atl1 [Falsarthrobacter nasiphocae]